MAASNGTKQRQITLTQPDQTAARLAATEQQRKQHKQRQPLRSR
jgi:hypothetical protein